MTDLYKDRPGFCELESLREGAVEEKAKEQDVKPPGQYVSLATYEKLLDAYTALLGSFTRMTKMASSCLEDAK